jgi:hypothetical protein
MECHFCFGSHTTIGHAAVKTKYLPTEKVGVTLEMSDRFRLLRCYTLG